MITTDFAKRLERPAKGSSITYDHSKGDDPTKVVSGFGLRVTAAGAKSFILNYRASGQERRLTIGRWPDWTVSRARGQARELRVRVDRGEDPLAERVALRVAPTMRDLADRYIAEHLPHKRPSSAKDDRAMLTRWVLPALGSKKVAAIRPGDIEDLHAKVTRAGRPIAANRLLSLLSKMFSLAIRWEYRGDNPAKGAVNLNPEVRRKKYLKPVDIARLTMALNDCKNRQAANAMRLLLLTGARRGEVEGATWGQFDLEAGTWLKPASTTKQKSDHFLPLSAPVLELLAEIKGPGEPEPEETLFRCPNLRRSWERVRKAAGLDGIRLHDLRHTFASILVSAGATLPLIGALLGHSNPATTARYAHLMLDPQRAAAERVGAIVTGSESGAADIVQLPRVRR
jgi:integrase